jgi:hypothetical protein
MRSHPVTTGIPIAQKGLKRNRDGTARATSITRCPDCRSVIVISDAVAIGRNLQSP